MYRPTHRLTVPASQIAIAQLRRRTRVRMKKSKNHRAVIERTEHQGKHPFPAGELSMLGFFLVTCIVVASAAMANVRRIHQHQLQRQKDEKRESGVKQTGKGGQDWQGFSYYLFLVPSPAIIFTTKWRLFAFEALVNCLGAFIAENSFM
jgi:NADH:ubiquinone oxidoreductase subunit 3 (subunit A)